MASSWNQTSWSKGGRSVAPQRLTTNSNVNNSYSDLEKRRLLSEFKNFNEEFALDNTIDVWKNDRLWGIIANELSNGTINYTAAKCKTEFSSMFGRYFFILKQKSFENAIKFPYFNIFHDELNLTIFQSDIATLKEEFDKINREKMLKEAEKALSIKLEMDDNSSTLEETRAVKYEETTELAEDPKPSSNDVTKESFEVVKEELPKMLDKTDPILDKNVLGKTFKSRFYIHDLPKKELLLNAVVKYNHRFATYTHEDIYSDIEPWHNVYDEIKNDVTDYSVSHCQVHFKDLFFQYKYIVERLKEWPHEKALKYWPFFRTFHCKLKLSCFWYSIDVEKAEFDRFAKDNTECTVKPYAPNVIPERFFFIYQKDECDKLLKSMKKYEEEFVSCYKCGDSVWDSEQIWKFIVKDMNAIVEKIGSFGCKSKFINLLDRYLTILKDLPEMSIEEARELFKFFEFFHFEMNLQPFCPRIKAHKKKFNENKLIVNPSSSSNVPEMPEDTSEDDDQEDVELVLSVREHVKEFNNFKIADDEVWTTVANDLKQFETSLEKGRIKWRERFYSLLRKFFKISAEFGDEEAQEKWLLYNQFKSLNLNPFLDRLSNPIQKKTREGTREEFSNKKVKYN